MVASEQFQQADADFGVVLKKLQAAGARAILKMGTGPSSITAAKASRILASKCRMLTSTDDWRSSRKSANVLGKDFYFVAGQTQVFNSSSRIPTRSRK